MGEGGKGNTFDICLHFNRFYFRFIFRNLNVFFFKCLVLFLSSCFFGFHYLFFVFCLLFFLFLLGFFHFLVFLINNSVIIIEIIPFIYSVLLPFQLVFRLLFWQSLRIFYMPQLCIHSILFRVFSFWAGGAVDSV